MFFLFVRSYTYTTMQNSLPTPELYNRFLENRSNAAELELLFAYFGTADDAELRNLVLEAMQQEPTYIVQDQDARLSAIHDQLSEKIFGAPEKSLMRSIAFVRTARIAAMLFIAASVSFLIYKAGKNQSYKVVPGGQRGELVVNGLPQHLTGQKKAVLYQDNGVTVTTRADGSIVYTAYHADSAIASKMNTLETPKGGEYRVTLSDGSVVTLNSGSRLSFPTGFRAAERNVTLQGEAFFEVAKNADMPFIVKVEGRAIRVLGTKFNVSSYAEENGVTATLIEGSILFSDENSHQTVLHPNQQVNSRSGKLSLKTVDAADYMAWTKGEFLFNDVPIAIVMQKLARWYDVEVDAETLPEKNLYLKVSRHANIKDLLKMVSKATDLDFELEGNKILLKE